MVFVCTHTALLQPCAVATEGTSNLKVLKYRRQTVALLLYLPS